MAIKNKQQVKTGRANSTNTMPQLTDIVEGMLGSNTSTLIESGRVSISDEGIEIAGFNATPASLTIPDNLTPKMLDDVIEVLFSLEGVLPILIGDALNAADSLQYGDISIIAEHFGREAKTLSNWKSICKSVKSSLRKELWLDYQQSAPLSIGHYNLLQAMSDDEQEHWIRQAYENKLSIARLSKAINEANGKNTVEALPMPFADRETRNRMNRVWRAVSSGDLTTLKQDDIRLLRDWLNQLEGHAGK